MAPQPTLDNCLPLIAGRLLTHKETGYEYFMQHAHALTQPFRAACGTVLPSTVAPNREQPSCLGGGAEAIWCMQAAEQGSAGG